MAAKQLAGATVALWLTDTSFVSLALFIGIIIVIYFFIK
jgi:hypothetical protein